MSTDSPRPSEVQSSVESVFREEHGRLLASLVRRFGDLDLAEEVASEAVEAALVHWPAWGVPARPGAWLLTTARRKAVDRLRRDQAYAARLAILQVEADRADHAPPADSDRGLPDDRLQMFFTCAHPALAAEDRTALTLRCLAGLTTPEVTRAFLVPTATMAQRIVRAKKKIREARIPFRVPGTDKLPKRLPSVLQVIYSVFTEGYAASSGPQLQRLDLAQEAIRLARILRHLMPAEREVAGLLGLMVLIHARHEARTGPNSELVLLDDQDRGRWDHTMIEEGNDLAVPDRRPLLLGQRLHPHPAGNARSLPRRHRRRHHPLRDPQTRAPRRPTRSLPRPDSRPQPQPPHRHPPRRPAPSPRRPHRAPRLSFRRHHNRPNPHRPQDKLTHSAQRNE
ncbi:RNA polymerase sigma factor [Streptomyces sp. NPDC014744]|uniref:RNA polymerase sigma factor n=1 Tax=Streptomyces sp. NPDC014744 TaxID=3364903 RepID=UPI0036FD2027